MREPSPSEDEWGVLKTTSIQPGQFLPEHNKLLPRHLEPRPLLEVKPGDILLTCAGPRARCGVSCLVERTRRRLMISGKMYRFRTRADTVEPKYLASFLQTKEATAAIDRMKAGSSESGLNLTHERFRQLLVPVAPLTEQQRIVGILGKAFEGAAIAEANAEKNLQNARALFESCLESAFVKRGEGWEEKPLAELCDPKRIITYGVIKLGDEVADGIPCLRTSNVRRLYVETDGIKRIAPALSSEYSRTILKGGEVLVGVRGTLGGVAVASREMAGWNVSREVAVVPVDPSRVDPAYLSYLIGSGASQKWLGGVKKGAAYVGINIQDLRRLPVSAPELSKQMGIVRHLESLQEETRRLESTYQRRLAALEDLKKSLLHNAFTGQLGTRAA
jgi:type I restriction enzyme S subunit